MAANRRLLAALAAETQRADRAEAKYNDVMDTDNGTLHARAARAEAENARLRANVEALRATVSELQAAVRVLSRGVA